MWYPVSDAAMGLPITGNWYLITTVKSKIPLRLTTQLFVALKYRRIVTVLKKQMATFAFLAQKYLHY